MKNVRARVIIEGIVQGVFFRAHTQKEAQHLGVSGWVKNRHDGTVEALFEGDQERVQTMINWCHAGPPHALVDNVNISWGDYTGEYSGFSVTY
jgi:acylphosphatase